MTGKKPHRRKGKSGYPQISNLSLNPLLRWIYRLFLAIDANFRLKRKQVSSEKADPSLGKGWAYFVEQDAYTEYLRKFDNETQPVCAFFTTFLSQS